jgi:uncharacterized membrane protein
MIRCLMNSIVFAGFTLLLPAFGFMVWSWGSSDEKFLMKAAVCSLGPFCADFWYLIVAHLVLRRQSSYLMQALIIIGGYAGIALLLKQRVIAF